MTSVLRHRSETPPLDRIDDAGLAARACEGDGAAFEALYDRHHEGLLAFCRHMLGSREESEDVLAHTFQCAQRLLRAGPQPAAVRPWLFGIARERCRTRLAGRRLGAGGAGDPEPSLDGLAEDVRRRPDLRELVAGLGRLPDDQREALVLVELGALSDAEIAGAIGCPAGEVKALVLQARMALIAERDARETRHEEARGRYGVARSGVLRRGVVRRHLRQCQPFRAAVASQRAALACVLPVAPTAGLKATVLAGVGVSGGAGSVAAGVTAGEVVSLGGAAGGGGCAATGGATAATIGGVAVKGLALKLAVTAAVGVGVSGAVATVHDRGAADATGARAAETTARTVGQSRSPAAQTGVKAPVPRGIRSFTGAGSPRRVARAASVRRSLVRRLRRGVARRLTPGTATLRSRRRIDDARRRGRRRTLDGSAAQAALGDQAVARRGARRHGGRRRRPARPEPPAAPTVAAATPSPTPAVTPAATGDASP